MEATKQTTEYPLEDQFREVNVFDGGIGRDGQYVWKSLPSAMTKRQAIEYTEKAGWCPPERFR